MSQTPDQLAAKRVELILQQLEQLPTLPAVAVQVLETAADNPATVEPVVTLISSDPALTARILQLVNTTHSVRQEVTTLDKAVVLLGFEAVRGAVLALSIFETFRHASPHSTFSREDFWKHSLAVGCCAELLAEALPPGERNKGFSSSEAFVCGLLHDLGKIALDTVLPKSFARVTEAAELLRGNIADLERSVIGLDHMVIGKRLAERWNLPTVIRECIWLHGQFPEAIPANVKSARLINIVTLADLLVREQHLGYSGNYTFPIGREKLLEAIGLPANSVESVLQHLLGRIEARATAMQVDRATTHELFEQALTRANQELGKVTNQLEAKNRRLAVRAKLFDALSDFQGELLPDAPPPAVLAAVGQTAVGILQVGAVGVFSLMPAQDFAEVVLLDGAGKIFETTLVDCTERPIRQEGAGPVLQAGDELQWLLAAISPRLVGEQRFWICLEAEDQCIGGVVWGAAAGESQRLGGQARELSAVAGGWALALRTAQIRQEARALSEQLAETNRRLQSANNKVLLSRMMMTVGEMAAGAAHEMNNPLAVISGRSQLLAAQLADPKHRAMAHLIHEQSHRLSEIITDLMDFAKPVPPDFRECDPAELIARALHDAKQQSDPADRNIEFTMGDVPAVMVDAVQVSAAICEVIGNALHATDPSEGNISLHAAYDASGNRVVITVADNGCGMDEATLKRAFDPFFSNKPAGRRRGMGLPKALRWVEASGGSMRLESRPQQGTRTVILLPAVGTQELSESGSAKGAARETGGLG